MRKHHKVRFGWVRLGMVRLGLVRSCYAAYRSFTEASVRCVSICGLAWHGGAGTGMVWFIN